MKNEYAARTRGGASVSRLATGHKPNTDITPKIASK